MEGGTKASASLRSSLTRSSSFRVFSFRKNYIPGQWFLTFLSHASDEGFSLENAKIVHTVSGAL